MKICDTILLIFDIQYETSVAAAGQLNLFLRAFFFTQLQDFLVEIQLAMPFCTF
jgi:hypothetical protein